MKIGIVIVHYNRKDLLRDCLRSVGKIDYPDFRVLVVDNGSEDGSAEMVRDEFPEVELIPMGYNSGFCIANNEGIRKMVGQSCEAVLLLNNDTEVAPDFLKMMVPALHRGKKIGMIAPKILLFDKKDLLDSAGIEITPDGLGKNRGFARPNRDFREKCEVFCPAGAAALYSKELLLDTVQDRQFLDEDYNFYFEELDLGWRARLRGWRCAYVPEAIVYHRKSATAGPYSRLVAYYTNRNIFFNIVKNYPLRFAVRALVFSAIRYFLLLGGFFFRRGPGYKIKACIGIRDLAAATLKGWADFLAKLLSMLKKRKEIQKRKLASKKEINSWFKKYGITFLDSVYK